MRALFTLLVMLFLVTGCAGRRLPPLQFATTSAPTPTTLLPAALGNSTVFVGVPSYVTDEVVVGSERYDDILKAALDKNLAESGPFDPTSARKLDVIVTLFKLNFTPKDQIFSGTTAEAGVRYQLVDQRDRSVVFSTDIPSSAFARLRGGQLFTATGPLGVRESVAEAMRNNLQQFLAQLKTLAEERRLAAG